MATNNKIYNCLDIAKFFFAVCVIAIHTQLPLPSPLGMLLPLANPAFFEMSGFLLFIKISSHISSAGQEFDALNRYRSNMIKTYLVWSIVYLPLTIYEYVIYNTGIIKGILFYVKDFFCLGGHYYSGHFWFLLSSIYGISLIIFFRKKQYSTEKIFILSILALLIQYIIYYIANGTFQAPLLTMIQQLISLTIREGQFLVGFYFLALSMIVTKYNKKISSTLLWGFCIGAFLIFAVTNCNLLLSELCLSISAICLTIGLSRITLSDHKIYIWLRRTSLIMYYSHNIIIFIWLVLLNPNNENSYGNFCFLFTITCTSILACIVNLIYEKVDKNNPARKLLQLLSL